jgi:iron-sulfur cluster assembly protein
MSTGSQAVVELTVAATDFLHKQLSEVPEAVGMRLSVKTAGCSGHQYVLKPVLVATATDLVYPLSAPYQLYIDPKSVPYLQGTIIDYVRQGLNRQLTYRNPNEVSSCGCGESFYVEEK